MTNIMFRFYFAYYCFYIIRSEFKKRQGVKGMLGMIQMHVLAFYQCAKYRLENMWS